MTPRFSRKMSPPIDHVPREGRWSCGGGLQVDGRSRARPRCPASASWAVVRDGRCCSPRFSRHRTGLGALAHGGLPRACALVLCILVSGREMAAAGAVHESELPKRGWPTRPAEIDAFLSHDDRVSEAEEDAMEDYWNERKRWGVERLYDLHDTFFFDDMEPPLHILIEHARMEGYNFPNLAHYKDKTMRIGDVDMLLSEKTMHQHFCPKARRVAWARAKGIALSFKMPSISLSEKKLFSGEKKNLAELLPNYVSDWEWNYSSVAPIVAVYDVPLECFLRFVWKNRFASVGTRALDVTREEGNAFVDAGEKVEAAVISEATDWKIAGKIGYFKYLKIVEELAVHPERDLGNVLDESIWQWVGDACENREFLFGIHRRESSAHSLTLRYCFFNVNATQLNEIGLGQIYNRALQERWGLRNIWTSYRNDTKLSPSPIYLRAVLCGAKEESSTLLQDVVERWTLDEGPKLRDWLLSGEGSLEFPDGSDLPGPYKRAMDCSAAKLLQSIKPAKAKRGPAELDYRLKLFRGKTSKEEAPSPFAQRARHLIWKFTNFFRRWKNPIKPV